MTSGSGSKGVQRRRSTKVLCGFLTLLMLGVWGVAGTPTTAGAATQTLAVPTGLAPDGGIDAGPNPTLTWDAVSGAAYYKVTYPSTAGVTTTSNVYATSYSPTADFPAATVNWSVTAYDNAGNFSPAASASFVNQAANGPTLNCPSSPVNYPIEAPTFTWNVLPNIKNYTLLVSTSPTFLPGSTATYVTQTSSYTLTKGQSDGQTYYAKVTGTSAGGLNTPSSDSCSYSVVWSNGTTDFNDAVPTLKSPTNAATVRDVLLKWNPMKGAARYEVEVSGNGDWTNGLLYDVVTDGTTWSPAKALDNGSYFWRIRGIDNTGNFSLWSDVPTGTAWVFNVAPLAAPTPMSPANGATLTNPNFKLSWAPVPGAGAYELQVSTSSSFTDAGTGQSCFTTHTDWSPYTYVSPPGAFAGPGGPSACPLNRVDQRGFTDAATLYWHVRAIDDYTQGELASPWNTTQFTNQTNHPPTNRAFVSTWSDTQTLFFNRSYPTKISPLSGSVTVPTLKWTQVPGTETYKVTVQTTAWNWNKTTQACDPGTSTSTKTYNTTGLSLTPALLPSPRKLDVPNDPPATGLKDAPCPVDVSWTVQSIDHYKRTSPLPPMASFTWSGYSNGGTSNGVVNLLSPSPADGATINTTPSFAWQPVVGADHYEVWWFTNPSDDVGLPLIDYNSGSDPVTEAFTPVQPLPVTTSAGAYEVVAIDAGGGAIAYSPRRLLNVAPPTPVTITSLSTNTQAGAVASCGNGCTLPATPLITWAANPYASYYRVYISQDPDFTNVLRVLETAQNNIRSVDALLDLQAGQAYYVFVQPALDDWYTGINSTDTIYGDNGATVRAAQRWSFLKQSTAVTGLKTIDPTSSVAGTSTNACDDASDKATVSDMPTFCWNPSQAAPYASGDVGAMRYHIQVSTTSDFSNIIDQALVDQASYTPYNSSVSGSANPGTGGYSPSSTASSIHDFTYPDGPLFWRVQAIDATNNPLTYSATGSVTKSSTAVSLTGPNDNATVGGTPSLTWAPKTFAAQYYVEVYKNGDTSFSSGNLIFHQFTDLTAITPTYNNNVTNNGQSLPSGDYVWRVRGIDAKGNSGAWTTAREFTVQPSAPSLITPSNNQSFPQSAGIAFSWTPVVGAVQYRIYIGTNNPPTSGAKVNITTVSTGWSMNQKLAYGKYYWQVQALNGQNLVLSTSTINTFTYSAYAPFLSANACVNWLYANLLGKTPPPNDTWASSISTGSKSCADLAYNLWTQPGFQDLYPIARLYRAYFLRIPDFGGMDYWIRQHRTKGIQTSFMSTYFAASAEFKATYGSLSNADFVTLVYENVLGRQNDPSGYAYWLNKLNTKRITRGQLMLLFSESAEYVATNMPTVKAELLVLEFLRRTPTQDEVAAYMAAMPSGSTYDSQVQTQIVGIMGTPEFKNLVD